MVSATESYIPASVGFYVGLMYCFRQLQNQVKMRKLSFKTKDKVKYEKRKPVLYIKWALKSYREKLLPVVFQVI